MKTLPYKTFCVFAYFIDVLNRKKSGLALALAFLADAAYHLKK